jgi:hypothetical protein
VDEDLTGALAPEAEPAAVNIEQARAAGLDDLDVRTAADAEFGEPADPARFAGYGVNLTPISGSEQFQGHEWYQDSLAGVRSY